MDAYGIIILNKIGNNITLYANSLKKGYYVLCCTRATIDRKAILLQWPEVKLLELDPGKHYIYCINDNDETDGDVQFNIDYTTETEQLENILILNEIYQSPYIKMVQSIKTNEYIIELYNQFKQSDTNLNEYENLLSVLTSDYNIRQEDLNYFVEPLFLTDKKTGSIVSYRKQLYTFIPYRYNISTQNWNIIRDQILYDSDTFLADGLTTGLYKIDVTLNGSLVRSFYWYEPTSSIKEQNIQEQINIRKIAEEKGNELVGVLQDEEIEENAYQTIAAILEFDNIKPVLRKPEIEIDQYSTVFSIPDYSLMILSGQKYYIALLEIQEIYADKKRPHLIPITGSSFRVNALQYLPNSDTEYIAYIVDNNGTILSQSVFISFDPDYPITEYSEAYQKIEFNRYMRKLYTVFKEYDATEWETISLIAGRYFLSNTDNLSFSDFILTQLSYLDSSKNNVIFMMQLVLLCNLRYFSNINQSFVPQQVYAVPYKVHIFPQQSLPYIIRVMKIFENKISYQYYSSGNTGTEIRVDGDDIVILQAIDPKTWKLSSIALYNNHYIGSSYFYFPKLEVEVKHGLY